LLFLSEVFLNAVSPFLFFALYLSPLLFQLV
jgi:hypothetical protein